MIIKNGKIFKEQGYFVQEDLFVEGSRIVQEAGGEIVDAAGLYVIPGLTDIHFHACMGYDFCDGTKEALQYIAKYQLMNGITTICPASMTFSEERLTEIFQNAAAYDNAVGATLVGINMEGPFISKEKRGAQNSSFIHEADVDMFFRLQQAAEGLIKLVDVAPETENAMEFIEKVSSGVGVSLAHTAADYELAKQAFEKGARQVTHLYNAMPAFGHRSPGVIGAACENEKVMVELICDGVHIHPSTVRATFKMFGDDRIIFISDSMMACGLADGQYTLGGQAVTVRGNVATLTGDGTIAGSVVNLMNCMKIAVQQMGIPLESAVKCAAVNPAKAIGIYDTYGSLTPGKAANIVLMNENLEICYIIKDGKIERR